MLWVAPIINLLMWIGYLIGAFILIWGLVPTWGGWRTLDYVGKSIVVCGGIICLVCMGGLATTSVMPF